MKKLVVALMMFLMVFSLFFFAGCPKQPDPAEDAGQVTPVSPGGDAGGATPPPTGDTGGGDTTDEGGY